MEPNLPAAVLELRETFGDRFRATPRPTSAPVGATRPARRSVALRRSPSDAVYRSRGQTPIDLPPCMCDPVFVAALERAGSNRGSRSVVCRAARDTTRRTWRGSRRWRWSSPEARTGAATRRRSSPGRRRRRGHLCPRRRVVRARLLSGEGSFPNAAADAPRLSEIREPSTSTDSDSVQREQRRPKRRGRRQRTERAARAHARSGGATAPPATRPARRRPRARRGEAGARRGRRAPPRLQCASPLSSPVDRSPATARTSEGCSAGRDA